MQIIVSTDYEVDYDCSFQCFFSKVCYLLIRKIKEMW